MPLGQIFLPLRAVLCKPPSRSSFVVSRLLHISPWLTSSCVCELNGRQKKHNSPYPASSCLQEWRADGQRAPVPRTPRCTRADCISLLPPSAPASSSSSSSSSSWFSSPLRSSIPAAATCLITKPPSELAHLSANPAIPPSCWPTQHTTAICTAAPLCHSSRLHQGSTISRLSSHRRALVFVWPPFFDLGLFAIILTSFHHHQRLSLSLLSIHPIPSPTQLSSIPRISLSIASTLSLLQLRLSCQQKQSLSAVSILEPNGLFLLSLSTSLRSL